ncbi:MAG: hypothetical protein V4586_15650 [Pseudomonadota bacterium]
MKHILAALTLFMGAAQILPAQTAECRAQPTRDCVFAMALTQAGAERKLMFAAEGYLAVAYLQEQDHLPAAAATRAALLKLLQADPDPAARVKALGLARSFLTVSDLPTATLPETRQWIADRLSDLRKQAGLPETQKPDPTMSQELIRAINAKVASNPADPLPKFARLAALRGPEVRRLNMRGRKISDVLTAEQHLTLQELFAKGALAGARAEIDAWPDAVQKANGYAALALALARAGEMQRALDIARLPSLSDLSILDYEARVDLAEVWARAGDGTQSAKMFAGIGGGVDFPSARVTALTAAIVSKDAGAVRDLLVSLGYADRAAGLEQGIDAARDQGFDPTEALMAVLPPAQKSEALYARGKVRIRIGDVAAAQATLRRMKALSKRGPYGWTPTEDWQMRELSIELAPMLAAMGQEVAAVQMAADLNRADITALVAARIE